MNIKDVAKLAGVSISTVSRVINNTANVRPEVREKVEKIIEDTGYRPNALAKELLKNKTNVIGVMLPRIDLYTFATAVEGITKTLNDRGYNILLVNTRDDVEEELKYFQLFQEKRVDGVLYFATGMTDKHIEHLSKIRYPIVLVGQAYKKLNYPYVKYDNYNAAKEIVNHLLDQGHKKIACLGVPDYDVELGKMRKEGYYDALKEKGVKIDHELVSIGDWECQSGYDGMKKIMETAKEKPTAVYAITERLAMAAMHYLIENGYKVPQDISVAGIDDSELSKFYTPDLTTAGFDYFKAGQNAAEMILDCVDKKELENREVVIDYELKVRKSTASRVI